MNFCRFVLRRRDLSTKAKVAMVALLDHFNHRTDQCNPHDKTLAFSCGLSERSLSRAIKEIKDARLIIKKLTRGAPVYKFAFELMDAEGSPLLAKHEGMEGSPALADHDEHARPDRFANVGGEGSPPGGEAKEQTIERDPSQETEDCGCTGDCPSDPGWGEQDDTVPAWAYDDAPGVTP